MNEIKDCRGITINVGDTIVYPGRKGSSMWLSQAVVVAPTYGSNQQSLSARRVDTSRLVEIFETNRCAVVQQASA